MLFRLWIYLEPEDGMNVTVNFQAKGSIFNLHYDKETSFNRHLSGEVREQVKIRMSTSSPANLHYEQFSNSHSVSVANCGNFNDLHSQAVLRKIKAENLSKDRLSSDLWLDIVSTKKTYDVSIKGNTLNGYIQTTLRQPVVIHMYSEDQILLLNHFNWLYI